MFVRPRRGLVGAVVVAAATALAAATAQAQQLTNAPVDLELFRPAMDSKGFITLNSSAILGQWDVSFGLVTSYARKPLVLNGPAVGGQPTQFNVNNLVSPSLQAAVGFTHLLAGFDNPALVPLVATLIDAPYTSRQATYDLRRLRRKGLIIRLPGRHRYQLTPLGRRVAVLFTKAYGRVLAPGLAALDPRLPEELSRRSPLATAWRQLDRTLDTFIDEGLAAA